MKESKDYFEENQPQVDYNQSSQGNYQEEKPTGLAITSMILGICSIVICCGGFNLWLGIAAVITGFIEKKNIDQGTSPEISRNYVKTGIICGFIGIAIFFVLILLYLIFGITGFLAQELDM